MDCFEYLSWIKTSCQKSALTNTCSRVFNQVYIWSPQMTWNLWLPANYIHTSQYNVSFFSSEYYELLNAMLECTEMMVFVSFLTTFYMWATNLEQAQLLPEIGTSLKPNHYSQVKLVIIFDTHGYVACYVFSEWSSLLDKNYTVEFTISLISHMSFKNPS